MLTNSSYTVIGEEPVAKPKIHFCFLVCLYLIKSAISLATAFDPDFEFSKITL